MTNLNTPTNSNEPLEADAQSNNKEPIAASDQATDATLDYSVLSALIFPVKSAREGARQVLCKVGGFEIMAVPGALYTFGLGSHLSGPLLHDEVPEEFSFDVNGLAVAIPIVKEDATPSSDR